MFDELPTLVYFTSWYDGPISGLADYEGNLLWFVGDPDISTWALFYITDEERALELEAKRSFELGVGTHCSLDIPLHERKQLSVKQQRQWYKEQDLDALRNRHRSYASEDRYVGEIGEWANSLQVF